MQVKQIFVTFVIVWSVPKVLLPTLIAFIPFSRELQYLRYIYISFRGYRQYPLELIYLSAGIYINITQTI